MTARRSVATAMSSSTCSIISLVRAYGELGAERVVLGDLEVVLDRVERGRRGEQHPRLAQRHQLVEQLQGLRDVVAVVLVGLLHRLGDDDPRGHVDRGVEVGVLVDDPPEQVAVGDVALVEDPVTHEGERSGEQRVEDHRHVTGLLQGLRRRRPDVAGAAGDQDLHASRVAKRARPPGIFDVGPQHGASWQPGHAPCRASRQFAAQCDVDTAAAGVSGSPSQGSQQSFWGVRSVFGGR